jgi:glycerate kinase
MGPLEDMEVEAGFAWFEDERTAVVEMARASGMELLTPRQLNPMKTTTYGTGELVRAAVEYGAKKILLAVGGSATVDGGTGAAAALGWRFLDTEGRPVSLGGRGLNSIVRMVRPADLELPPVEVMCDCDNPLCGPRGAARVYAPQKGATGEMVEELERGLAHLAELVSTQLGREIRDAAGAGAAGGLSAGAMAFMDAELVSGIEAVMAHSGLAAAIAGADWVITGEGSFDEQSLMGKVVSGVCRLAGEAKVKVAVVAGQVGVERSEYERFGISQAVACKQEGMELDYALVHSEELLSAAAVRLARSVFLSDSAL